MIFLKLINWNDYLSWDDIDSKMQYWYLVDAVNNTSFEWKNNILEFLLPPSKIGLSPLG